MGAVLKRFTPNSRQVYNEHKPRLAVSGWFHAALPSEMGDWPEHTLDLNGNTDPEGDKPGATSTLEQLKGAAGDGGVSGADGSDCTAFTDDFDGAEVRGQCVPCTLSACTLYLVDLYLVPRRRTAGGALKEVSKCGVVVSHCCWLRVVVASGTRARVYRLNPVAMCPRVWRHTAWNLCSIVFSVVKKGRCSRLSSATGAPRL